MARERETGAAGERLARRFLESHGLIFRAANVRSPLGEIDLVMEDPKTKELVFVEVKTRQGTAFGTPEQSVTARKRAKLRALVAWYCQRERWRGQVRVDVVGVFSRPGQAPTLSHTTYVG
ncbi:MAG: putative endonuclease [Parcubacteria group bacterium Gr01-1014_38]|nr:MAG: putative endonuclease [Parcubacteria group bacterium Gr01-1014_38]